MPKKWSSTEISLGFSFFSIYIYDLLSITSKKYAYADHLAILHSSGDWKVLERTLSEDPTTLSAYFLTWRQKLSHAKTVTAAFHLHNREAKRELKVKNNGKFLPFCPVPIYLGVKLDRRSRTVITLRERKRHCAKNHSRAFCC